MIEKGIKIFLGLVAILYVAHNPDGVASLAQGVVDAAYSFMKALTHLDLHLN